MTTEEYNNLKPGDRVLRRVDHKGTSHKNVVGGCTYTLKGTENFGELILEDAKPDANCHLRYENFDVISNKTEARYNL